MEEVTIEISWPEQTLQQLSEATKSRERAHALLTEMQQKLEHDGCPEMLTEQIGAAMEQLAVCVALSEIQIQAVVKEIAGFQQ